MPEAKSFKDLQTEWYLKLKETGFHDIENVSRSTRPLKEWHSFKITSERFQLMQASRALYMRQVDAFTHHPDFQDACRFISSHGNCKFSIDEIEQIWELHGEGYTRREIATRLARVKSRIDDVIKGLCEWMKLSL